MPSFVTSRWSPQCDIQSWHVYIFYRALHFHFLNFYKKGSRHGLSHVAVRERRVERFLLAGGCEHFPFLSFFFCASFSPFPTPWMKGQVHRSRLRERAREPAARGLERVVPGRSYGQGFRGGHHLPEGWHQWIAQRALRGAGLSGGLNTIDCVVLCCIIPSDMLFK